MLARKIRLIPCLLVWLCLVAPAANAADTLREFVPGSYQQILAQQANQPFVFIIWSITCPSCIKDMEVIKALHKATPDLKIIMLAADDLSSKEQVQSILSKHELSALENWVYADDNTQKLSFEIDPQWYGELPRTYFFDAKHQRTGVSGVLKKADFEAMFAKISPKP